MEVRIKNTVLNSVYMVTISLVFNLTEKDKLAKFGYPSVDIGGDFTDFVLETSIKKFSEFPIVQRFDGVELGHTLSTARAIKYSADMKIRITNVWTDFKAIPDSFQNEEVFTV